MVPKPNKYPFVIRLESDILESDGSSSMATVCGGTLALIDAGVPLKNPIAGIAIGLLQEESERTVLTDILGEEDLFGDLDFKLAGTDTGVTALQMDTKVANLRAGELLPLMERAREGRQAILEQMALVIAERGEVASESAPEMRSLTIAPHLVRILIGPKGCNIKSVQEKHRVDVRVNDEGEVTIFGQTTEAVEAASASVLDLVGTVDVGKDYDGTVAKVTEAGAFIRLFEAAEGWLHISEWEDARTPTMKGLLQVGDVVRVRVLGVDERGRIRVSRRAALQAASPT
jgi:polyribonucleotide nucleotidyltransferase